MKKLLFPFYPLLLGVIWVIVAYSANSEVLPSMSLVVVPALVITGIVAAVWGVTQLIVRDWKKSALVVTVVFLFTVTHGYIRDYTNIEGIRMVPVWLALAGMGVFAVVKLTRLKGREHLTVVGNVAISAILAVSLATSLSIPSIEGSYSTSSAPINELGPSRTLPDVYYIVPDTYARDLVLNTYLGYDNSKFTDFLGLQHFNVVEGNFANYHHSILSISSVMNMRYWTDEELGEPAGRKLGWALYNNVVGNTFKEAGYTYVQVGSWWSFTASNSRADITYQFSSLGELDFELYRLTLWYDLLDFLFDRGGNRILREAHLSQFEHLKEVSLMEEPTFTFCHMILPHPPFLFDENGQSVYGWLLTPEEWQEMYLDQLTYTNKLLGDAIATILSNSIETSGVPPIIIIASDEGYSDTGWQEYQEGYHGLQTMVEDRPDLVVKRQGTLLAVYGLDEYTPSSPVNIFRCVFNVLFDSQLEYLPDRYFLKSLGKYEHEFIEITEFINGQS